MKKKILLFMLMFILFPISVMADHIYNVDMNIYLDNDGNANITEKWTVEADSGSEWYKQLYNMGNQKLSDFTVMMDGKAMQYKEYWNVDDSMSEKQGYYGINYVSEGLELCFGKGDYKRHTFTLNYKLSNFIVNTTDSQILYQTLLPNVSLDNFSVIITSYYEFPDTLDVWGYGYKGFAYVKDGKIQMSNDGGLNNDYVVLLVKFPINTFNTTNSDARFEKFDDVHDMAEEGTYEYDYGTKQSLLDKIFNFVTGILSFLIPFGIICGTAVAASKSGYGYIGNKTIDKKNTPMFRDIPCNKDIYYANALIKLNDFGYKESNILGSIILKWVKNNKIGFKNETKGVFNKETSSIDLTKSVTFDNELERELFDMMYKASGDGILETKELEKWCRKNYSKFFSLFEKIKNNEIDKLKNEHHIYKRTNKEECKKNNVMDDQIYNDSVQLYGLKKYLQEFSKMDTKEVMEVHLWDEYLMFAYLFGIADKVASQLKKLYPEVIREMDMNGVDYNTLVFINHISTRSVYAASSARSAAENYSSGGGGFSSGGGGGGSFGGGGSMGGR